MPRKPTPETADTADNSPELEPVLLPFFFPNVGDGVTIFAVDEKKAREKAAEIRASMAKPASSTSTIA